MTRQTGQQEESRAKELSTKQSKERDTEIEIEAEETAWRENTKGEFASSRSTKKQCVRNKHLSIYQRLIHNTHKTRHSRVHSLTHKAS